MLNFENFPENLRLTDFEIANLSLQDTQKLFRNAENTLLPHEFKEWQTKFWTTVNRIRSEPNLNSLQCILKHLEEYKRNLGRHYSKQYDMRTMLKYNEIELDIRWLVKQYGLERHTLPYLLS